ncbi:MAG: RNA-binding domain-containing protein [Anaerolineaceae bacterium]
MDIHLHTPASSDFQQPGVTYLEILQRAEARGLNIISFTDHNSIAGYRNLKDEITQLEMLERLDRILPAEKTKLQEYRRLLGKILVLPGIEFTATFGFHILGLFSPDKPVREIEHLLISLNIDATQIDEGSATVGATTDVLSAYRLINQAGGLVIAAHANSSNGVAMRGFNFGGQTKIAYTQDSNLHALEVTDLELTGSRTTAAFFNGTKPEYPRRMHCIQGSDSHRLTTDPIRKKNLGIGDRVTEVFIDDLSFDALKNLFISNDFSRTRPFRHIQSETFDFIQTALEDGPSIIQDFHEAMTVRGGKLYAIIADICAFANTNGGTLYVGLAEDVKKPPLGVDDAHKGIQQLEKEISSKISPPLTCSLDTQDFKGKKIIRILVPRGIDPPYAVEDNKIYLRSENETGLAVRDEIVNLVLRGKSQKPEEMNPMEKEESSPISPQSQVPQAPEERDNAPRTGVEVISHLERQGNHYFTVRDLRNGNVVKNVTRASARKLWHYAINRYDEIRANFDPAAIAWHEDLALLRKYAQGTNNYYDLIERVENAYRYFFGVTENGIHGPWKAIIGEDEN